jgi:hypothetical protein
MDRRAASRAASTSAAARYALTSGEYVRDRRTMPRAFIAAITASHPACRATQYIIHT